MIIKSQDSFLLYKLADEFVQFLTPYQQNKVESIRIILNTLALSNTVTVYETIHGHIVEFKYTGLGVIRLCGDTLQELSKADCRWFEFSDKSITIGID